MKRYVLESGFRYRDTLISDGEVWVLPAPLKWTLELIRETLRGRS